MITILPADEMFLRSIHAPADVDAMVLRDGDGRETPELARIYFRDKES